MINMGANVLDYGFHFYLGWSLLPADFAIVQTINSALLVAITAFGVMQPVVARLVASAAKNGEQQAIFQTFFWQNSWLGIFLAATAWLLALPVMAQPSVPGGSDPTNIVPEAQTTFRIDDLLDLVVTIANWILVFIGIIGVIFLLYGAFIYITAGGNDEKVGQAKKTIIYALIGIAVAILAFAIVSFVASIIT